MGRQRTIYEFWEWKLTEQEAAFVYCFILTPFWMFSDYQNNLLANWEHCLLLNLKQQKSLFMKTATPISLRQCLELH